ncbi:MAG: T9SS type A sorting domain-containing protein [Saprospiraceae bacterium]|nr:T9SS type A sorting domain-containing protein [Saprospiraceae bacterium]
MKHNYLLFSLLFSTLTLLGQSPINPKLLWATPIQAASDSPEDIGMEFMDLAVSPEGDTYVTGYCTAPCAFGPGAIVTPDAGGQSIFIAKYKPSGQFEWVKDLGTIGEGSVHITAPFLDGVYLATSFTVASVNLGNGISVNKVCAGSNCADGLLVKIDPTGATLWAKTYTGDSNSSFQANGIVHSGIGKMVAMYSYGSTLLNLGPGFVFDDKPETGIFVSFFDAGTGATTDVKFPGNSPSVIEGRNLAFNQNGAGVITGVFFDQITFTNGVTLTTTDVFGSYFVAGMDAIGNIQWVSNLSSSDYVDLLSAKVNNAGDVYLALDVSGVLYLDNNQILTVNTNYAGTVLKLDGNSFYIPVFIPYDSDDYPVMDLAIDPWDNINTVGYTSEPIFFGNKSIIPDGCVDGLITRTTIDGAPYDARTIGGGGCEAFGNYYYGSCIEFDEAGYLYGAGGFLFNFNEDGINFNGRGGFVSRFITPTLSTNEQEVLTLDAFPNPNSGSFTIQLPEIPESEALLSITNLSGQEVYRQSGIQQEILVKTNLSSGIYLVSVIDGKRVYQQKVTVL